MRISLIIVLLGVTGQVVAQSSKKESPVILFSVNKAPVYTDEFVYLFKKNHPNPQDFTEKKVNEYLDLFVNFKLKVAEAKTEGIDTTSAFRKEFRTYKEELKKPFVAGKDDLDRLTKEVYDRLTEEVRASHILIMVKPDAFPADTLAAYNKALSVRQRVLTGEDFNKVAKELSEDPSARVNGGDLGYFTAMQMVYPFEQAAYTLKVGEISNPVRTRFGYHLVKLFDRRKARGEVEVSHIILRTESPKTQASGYVEDKKVRNKIFEIFDQIRAGRKWEDLVKEYSEDQSTKENGGKLRPFGIGVLAGVPEFEAVAFSLKKPGDYSDPFQTAYGWHIVRLERQMPVPPYADVEQALKKRIARDERLQVADRKRLDEKKKQFGLVEFGDVKAGLMKMADSSLLAGRWKYKGDQNFKSRTLITLQGKEYTVASFVSFSEKSQSPSTAAPGTVMQQLYDAFVDENITQLEDEKLIAENSDFRNLLTEYKEGILLFTIMEKEVWNRGSEDSVSIRKYYEINRSKYTAGERVHARVFQSSDKDFRDAMKTKIDKGDSLSKADIKGFKAIVPFRNYAKGESKGVDRAPWATGLHPVDIEDNYYLIEIDNLVVPGVKTLDEARAQVVADRQEEREKTWLAELRKKYAVKINNKGKKLVISELTKK